MNPLDQQQKSNKAKDGDDELDGDALGEAPASLFGPQADEQEDFFFAPALGDLPELDLPDILDLPNLPTNLVNKILLSTSQKSERHAHFI